MSRRQPRQSDTGANGVPHVALVFKQLRASGGAERMASVFLDVFRSFDVRLSVVARHMDGVPDGFEFHRVNPPHLGRAGRVTGFARAACRKLSSLRPDLVLSQEHMPCCHVYRAGGGAHAEWLRQRRRVQGPLKRTWQRWDPHQRAKLALERATYESPHLRAVICNSAMVRDDILRHYRVAPERLHVIENALDPDAYRPPANARREALALRQKLGVPAGAALWLFVGSGFERKGLDVAVRALARAPGTPHLAVVGRDRHARHYRRLAARSGVAGRVHFVGRQADVRPYYWAGDGLLHPALYEAYGLVVLEAMAAGLPVLGSRQCGAANALIRQGENGYLNDALDIDAWADAIGRIDGVADRESLRRAAMAAAMPHDLARLRGQVRELCDYLLAGVRSGPAAGA
ncbi:glycosyl transferase group 1 [Salinisphaera sp. PC39]|uniref:glycosyltransferase family 4 protein n=1 Tax=Salinisphaera sp. PC39 TaxID=1304156 RepID=UPI003340177C